MHWYLKETEYAVRGLFTLLGEEDARCAALRQQALIERGKRVKARAILSHGAPPSGFGEDTTPYFERRAREATRNVRALQVTIESLETAIAAKAFSVGAIAGSILQIAKQAIALFEKTPHATCPSGRPLAQQSLKNVIWQGRNQAMHWEDGEFGPPTTACFQHLEQSFGERFRLSPHAPRNLAKDVIDLLQWTGYDAYLDDMESLLS